MTLVETKILQVLNDSPASRRKICQTADIKWTTAYDALQRLEVKGSVAKFTFRSGRGRPLIIWYLENKSMPSN